MFKYESFPSSSNMSRLAKITGTQWKDIRDWFVGRRSLSKKNGLYLRNQLLTSCSYCPDCTTYGADRAIVHLLSGEHIYNMVNSMEKYNAIFTQLHNKKSVSTINDLDDKETLNSEKKSEDTRKEIKDKEEIANTKTELKTSKNDRISEDAKNGERKSSSIENKVYVKEYDSLAVKQFAVCENTMKLDNPFKTPIIPSEKCREKCLVLKKNIKKNIDSTLYIGYRCPICLKIFNTEWMLIRHSISHRQLICSECDEVFLREDLLQLHFMQHMIESMDDDLYPLYICFKCCNLSCICVEDTHCAPSLNYKHYIRPQTARRSKPFRSAPYSGVNEHLKVTMDEFWEKYKTRRQKPRGKQDRISSQLKSIKNKIGSKLPAKKQEKKTSKLSTTPTYTNITTFNCPMCESFFFTPDELKEHVTVHRIQARNRNKKREHDNGAQVNKIVKYAKIPSTPPKPVETFICSYCSKNFKTKNILFKHVRLPCKSVPYALKIILKNKTPVHLEKINKSHRYKICVKTEVSPVTKNSVKPSKVKCDLCSADLLPNQVECHKRLCCKKYMKNSDKRQLKKTTKKQELKVNANSITICADNEELYYFLCKYCDTPLSSSKMLLFHVKESCNRAPNEVLSELEAQRLSSLEVAVDKHYTKIERNKLLDVLPVKKIQHLLEESSFLCVHKNYKRVKCKFCGKIPLKSCLKLHLMSQCKNVPEEILNLMKVHGNSLSSSLKKNSASILKNTVPGEGSVTRDMSEDESTTGQEDSLSSDDDSQDHDMLYDCHLCEEKFKISKDFITHMQDFHCMTISEESACKWLSNLDLDTEEGPAKSDHNDNEQGPERPKKNDELEEQKVLTYDTIGSEMIEESLLEDYNALLEEADVTEASSDKSENNSPTNTPSKKLDDELLDDLTNLDNFIETVQLEDLNFSTS